MAIWKNVVLAGVSALALGLAACEQEGPAEQAGESIDQSAEQTGEQMEQAGEQMQEQAQEAPEAPR